MLIDQAMLIIIFKVLTLIGVCVIALFGYMRYLRPMLQQMLDEFHGSRAYLVKTKGVLDQQQGEIEQRAQEQQEIAQQLSHKIALWNTAVKRHRDIHDARVRAMQAAAAQELALQQQRVMRERLYKSIALQALDEAERAMTIKYQQALLGKAFIHDMVSVLKDKTA